jgi:hypothetical protein
MTCSEVRRVLPELLDGGSGVAVPEDFEIHLESCEDCSDLVSDLKLISSEAQLLSATEEPPARVWVRIAAELRAEGLIREPETIAVVRPSADPTPFGRRWSALWLAPVAAALLASGTYVVSHRQSPPVAHLPTVPAVPAMNPQTAQASPVAAPPSVSPDSVKIAEKSLQAAASTRVTAPPLPSADDQQFLSVVSTRAPSMRATYESQLQTVNADIRETQAYVQRNPGDADARQHLMDAYEQKALLYQIALDRIQ